MTAVAAPQHEQQQQQQQQQHQQQQKQPPRPLPPAPLDSYDGTGTRLSSAFERTMDTWNDHDAVASNNARLQSALAEEQSRSADLARRLRSLESAAAADRSEVGLHQLTNAVDPSV
jgi:hypothetical protein